MSVRKKLVVFLGAFICCFLWGSAFPAIKYGYKLWNIKSFQIWRIIRFAGVRFFLAGIIVIILGSIISRKPLIPKKGEWGKIMLLSLFQTIGQYTFFYMGLAHTKGVNAAVINSLTTFFAIIIASLFMHMETLTFRKILGCIFGFSGVFMVNITPNGFGFKPLGDGLVMLSAVCYGVSSCLIKKYSEEHDTVMLSGYQFAFGGLVMTILGYIGIVITGDSAGMPILQYSRSNMKAVIVLIYLALVSSIAYTLWGLLLKKNDVSRVSVVGFMTPVIAVILSAIFLNEADSLTVDYIFGLILIITGIIIVNRKNHVETIDN
ncbi:MAG: DMT family transporter [Eubacterium sp.]|nr:DMT family transporter [Eubacterium sp.]